ncbi:MAG: AMP-binding protein, partial [Bdellovibrionales bacterium]|nr:AMP-binding protein [Bdellovibrionales bacterium]
GVVQKNLLAKLGLDKAVHIFTGSAATPSHLFHFFHKLGITLQEAYGMSENFAYSHLNIFEKVKLGSVGIPYPQVKCRIGENHEVQIWSPANMVGYYKNDEATAEAFTSDGYLKTGDQGRIDDDGFLFITGRVKELFKTSKGKYVSPTPIEDKFFQEDLFEQVCVMGDGFPQPFAVVKLAQDLEDMDSELNERIKKINKTLDSHERIAKICVINDSWTVENGFLTPTLKIKRSIIEKHYAGYFDHWMTQKSVVVYQR